MEDSASSTTISPKHAPSTSFRRRARRRYLTIGMGFVAIVVVLLGVQALTSRYQSSPDGGLHFVIPDGASKDLNVPTIDSAIEVPTRIVFKPGEPAILTIRNDDSVANRAGPWVIGAGQTYTAKFNQPGTYEYACAVDPAESVTVIVEGSE